MNQDNSADTIDPRHLKRIKIVQELFAKTFMSKEFAGADASDYQPVIQQIIDRIPEIDKKIAEFAPERPLSDINKVDLAILRAIVFESESTKTPKKVLINEAVELAKELSTDNSPKFINGVLGKLLMDA